MNDTAADRYGWAWIWLAAAACTYVLLWFIHGRKP